MKNSNNSYEMRQAKQVLQVQMWKRAATAHKNAKTITRKGVIITTKDSLSYFSIKLVIVIVITITVSK